MNTTAAKARYEKVWAESKALLDDAVNGGRTLRPDERALIEDNDAELETLRHEAGVGSDPLTAILRIFTTAAGRPLTRAKAVDLAEYRLALRESLADVSAVPYIASLLDFSEDAEDGEALRLYTELARAVERDRLIRKYDSFKEERVNRVETSPARDVTRYGANVVQFKDLLTQFRHQGYAAAEFETRALQSVGGSAYGSTFHEQLTVFERSASPMFDPNIVSINNVPNGGAHVFPRLTADPNHGGTVTAEAAGINELDATISAKTATPFKYAVMQLWSSELDTDNVINLERALASSAGRELALDIGAHLTTGGGGGSLPEGFITSASNGGTAAGGTATQGFDFVAPHDLARLYMSVASPYRARGTWQVSTTAFRKILEWRDTDGVPIALPLADSPSGLGIYGRPLVENPALAAVASATKSIAFGDFSRFEVVRLPVRVEISRDYKFGNDQVALRVIERVDGALVDAAAVAYLISANT